MPAAPFRVVLLSAVTTGASPWIDVSAYTHLTFFVKTNGNPGAGTVILEEGDFDPLTEAIPSQTASAIDTIDVDLDVGTSTQLAVHLGAGSGVVAGAYGFVRARIGTTVTVTTVDVILRAI